MTTNFCDACGRLRDCVLKNGAYICPVCQPDIEAEIDRLKELKKSVPGLLAIARAYFRDHHDSGPYQLRSISRDLKLAAQHRALDEGLTLREFIFKALEEYLQKGD